ncbi:hypothetical protein BGZ54_005333 [Gamsiella multidivaricata]|nr:hypothetical protein BGZ54_005333 [Gamsiella multidivaricata]
MKCGDIFCSTHCSKGIPLDQALDFSPSEGVMSRACVGCFEAYEQWQGLVPSGRNPFTHVSEDMTQAIAGGSTKTGTASSSNHRPNLGRIPDGYLGGESTREAIGREDVVRQTTPASANIAIKKQSSTDTSADTHPEHVKTTQELDKFLQERPAPEELVEKNILKDPKLAPALQHQAEELKKAKLEDALAHKIENRPPPEKLIEQNILHDSTVAPRIQKQAEELKRTQLQSALNSKLEHRPAPEELVEKHIL